MLEWKEQINLEDKFVIVDALITDTQHLAIVKNTVRTDKPPFYVEYVEEKAQTKRFELTATDMETAKKEAEEVIMKYLFNEAHAWLKRYNRFKEAVFNEATCN